MDEQQAAEERLAQIKGEAGGGHIERLIADTNKTLQDASLAETQTIGLLSKLEEQRASAHAAVGRANGRLEALQELKSILGE